MFHNDQNLDDVDLDELDGLNDDLLFSYGGLPFVPTQHMMILTFMMTPKISNFI